MVPVVGSECSLNPYRKWGWIDVPEYVPPDVDDFKGIRPDPERERGEMLNDPGHFGLPVILIVEYGRGPARTRPEPLRRGAGRCIRFRPIIMTSLAFNFSVLLKAPIPPGLSPSAV